jgi:hypothetical protein
LQQVLKRFADVGAGRLERRCGDDSGVQIGEAHDLSSARFGDRFQPVLANPADAEKSEPRPRLVAGVTRVFIARLCFQNESSLSEDRLGQIQ